MSSKQEKQLSFEVAPSKKQLQTTKVKTGIITFTITTIIVEGLTLLIEHLKGLL